jgi:antirestriction protein ArdC
MKKKERINLYQEVTDRIVAEMEKGVDSWQRTWGSSMPRNLTSKRDYNGINTFLLWLEQRDNGYATGDWMSFKQAKEMGGTVKKGEQGTRIVFFKRLDRDVENEHGEPESRQVLMAKYSYIFNSSQIDGLDQKRVLEAQKEHQEAQVLLDDSGAKIIGGQPSFSPKEDVIRMPEKVSFDSLNDYYATALHELVHWSGHKNRLDRNFEDSKRWGDEAYAVEELVAELGSAFLSAKCGIQGKLQHAEYLNNWIEVLKNDNRAIFTAASKAREASEYIHELSLEQRKTRETEIEEELSL